MLPMGLGRGRHTLGTAVRSISEILFEQPGGDVRATYLEESRFDDDRDSYTVIADSPRDSPRRQRFRIREPTPEIQRSLHVVFREQSAPRARARWRAPDRGSRRAADR